MRQGGILFETLEFTAHFITMRQVFPYVYVLFGNYEQEKAGQLQFLNLLKASSNHAGSAILSFYDSMQPSVFKFVKFILNL